MEARVHVGEEVGQPAVPGEAEHHARVGCHGEQTGVPDAEDDQRHEGEGAALTEDVDEDLDDWLADGGVDGVGEVLDGEEEGDEEEEAKHRRAADGGEDAEGSVPFSVLGFFGEVGRGVWIS